MKYSSSFFRRKDGSLSIEFAFCFCLISILVYIVYDVYSTIMLQNKLERVNYTVASIFRERSALYKDRVKKGTDPAYWSFCPDLGTDYPCGDSYELFDQAEVNEIGKLASFLMLNRDVALRVESLLIFQHKWNPANMAYNQLRGQDIKYCSGNVCSQSEVENYFYTQLDIKSWYNEFYLLSPYVKHFTSSFNLGGRYIPIYRVTMCIVNEKSLFLKWIDSTIPSIKPALCNEVIVLSRCNSSVACPTYVR